MPYRAGGQNDLSCEWHYIQLQKYYKQCRTIVDCFYCKTTFIAIIFSGPLSTLLWRTLTCTLKKVYQTKQQLDETVHRLT